MFTTDEQKTINDAIAIMESKALKSEFFADSAENVKNFCQLKMGALKNTEFAVMFLNNKHEMISFETLFKGTVSAFVVHSREVVRRALLLNASAVIFAHNKPSGSLKIEFEERAVSEKLVNMLGELDIRVLDHVVVGLNGATSLNTVSD